jgi:hypothetical protein
MPEVTDGGLRVVFFLSFLGRIVSELGFVRMLPFTPALPLPPTAICGIDVTVSVSTVIFRVDPSPESFPRPAAVAATTLYGFIGGTGFGRGTRGFEIVVCLIFKSSLLPPLSLPLSVVPVSDLFLRLLPKALSIILCCSAFLRPSSVLSSPPPTPTAGLAGRLISCTVSRVELAPLAPRAGVRIPGTANSSSSESFEPCLPSMGVELDR